MIQRSTNRFLFGTALSIGALAAIFVLSAHLRAQTQQGQQEGGMVDLAPEGAGEQSEARPESAFQVGTYNPEEVFQSHSAQEELAEASQTARTQLQQAQQADNQEEMEGIQQEYQATQSRIVEKFRSDVDEKLPEAAEAAGVQVIATEVVYTAEDVETKDITPALIEALSEGNGEDEDQAPAALPFQPQGG